MRGNASSALDGRLLPGRDGDRGAGGGRSAARSGARVAAHQSDVVRPRVRGQAVERRRRGALRPGFERHAGDDRDTWPRRPGRSDDVAAARIGEAPRAQSRLPDRQDPRRGVAAVPRRVRSRSHPDARPGGTPRQTVPQPEDRRRGAAARAGRSRRRAPATISAPFNARSTTRYSR